MLYYIMDAYTGEIMDVASTQRLCDEKYDDLVAESRGLFIWSIVRARSRREAEIIFSERNLSADLAPW